MGDKQTYRFNWKLRRRGQAALDHNESEIKSEDYDTDEEFCYALASLAMEMLISDRDELNQQDNQDDES